MTAAETYAEGYTAAQAAIAILAQQMPTETLRTIAQQNIIRVEHSGKSDYEYGASAAWGDWQAQDTRTRRAAIYAARFARRA